MVSMERHELAMKQKLTITVDAELLPVARLLTCPPKAFSCSGKHARRRRSVSPPSTGEGWSEGD